MISQSHDDTSRSRGLKTCWKQSVFSTAITSATAPRWVRFRAGIGVCSTEPQITRWRPVISGPGQQFQVQPPTPLGPWVPMERAHSRLDSTSFATAGFQRNVSRWLIEGSSKSRVGATASIWISVTSDNYAAKRNLTLALLMWWCFPSCYISILLFPILHKRSPVDLDSLDSHLR